MHHFPNPIVVKVIWHYFTHKILHNRSIVSVRHVNSGLKLLVSGQHWEIESMHKRDLSGSERVEEGGSGWIYHLKLLNCAKN